MQANEATDILIVLHEYAVYGFKHEMLLQQKENYPKEISFTFITEEVMF